VLVDNQTNRTGRFDSDDEEEKTEISKLNWIDICKEFIFGFGNIMRNGSDRHLPYGPHTMVNRSDSEKLSDVKSLFKSETHIQNLYPTDVASLNKVLDNNSATLDDIELYEVGQSPFWRARSEDDAIVPSYSRRRSVVAPVEDGDRLTSYRKDSRGVDASNGEDREKILEILREVVRKCSNPDPGKRPTAHELLTILNMKSNVLRDK